MSTRYPSPPQCLTGKGAHRPEHQDLERIAIDTLHRLRYLCAAQWAKPQDPSNSEPVAQALRQHFGQRSGPVQKRLQTQAQAMTEAAVAPHLFGRYAKQAPSAFLADEGGQSLHQQRRYLQKRLGFSPGNHKDRIQGQRARDIWDIEDQALDYQAQDPELSYLSFRIDKIRCIDETNPEWWGQDQIALAGLAVDAKGKRTPILPKSIGKGFDDGDEENFYPALNCHAFDLRSLARDWRGPQKFLVALVLAEQDRGELHTLLEATWGEVTRDVQTTLESQMGPPLGAYARPWMSNFVSAATAWVLSEFFSWLTQAFEDDIFAPGFCWMTMQHPNARFTQYETWGSPRSPRLRAHYFGYGGHYAVEYHWTLHN